MTPGATASRAWTRRSSPRCWPAAASGSAGRRAPGSSTPTWATRCWARSSRRSPATGYADTVRRRILDPLGLAHTGFEAGQFDPAQLARGYQRGAAGWAELPFDGYGAFAPMGGVFSTWPTWPGGRPGSPMPSRPATARRPGTR